MTDDDGHGEGTASAEPDFTPEDFAPPGHTWTRDDELARMEHRKALAAPPIELMRKQPHVT